MDMVAHHRVGQAINAKHGRQEFELLPNPFTTMFEGFPGLFIRPAQKGPTNTPLTRMHNLNLTRIQVLTTSKYRRNTPSVTESNSTTKHQGARSMQAIATEEPMFYACPFVSIRILDHSRERLVELKLLLRLHSALPISSRSH